MQPRAAKSDRGFIIKSESKNGELDRSRIFAALYISSEYDRLQSTYEFGKEVLIGFIIDLLIRYL